MVQMSFCDLSHTFHKQVTNVSLACFCHPTVRNFDVSPKLNIINGLGQLVHDTREWEIQGVGVGRLTN